MRVRPWVGQKEYNKGWRLKKLYGITLAQFDEMLVEQLGVCAICKRVNADGKRLAVDHDHATGKIRGLLCQKCNGALGSFNDSTDTLIEAVNYLRKHGK